MIKQLETELANLQQQLDAELANRQQMEAELADLYVKQEEGAQTTATLDETRQQLDEAIASLETFETQANANKQALDAVTARANTAEQKVRPIHGRSRFLDVYSC